MLPGLPKRTRGNHAQQSKPTSLNLSNQPNQTVSTKSNQTHHTEPFRVTKYSTQNNIIQIDWWIRIISVFGDKHQNDYELHEYF